MKIEEINEKLKQRSRDVVTFLFKGAGSFKGNRFSVGSIDGDEGDSFCVFLDSGRFKEHNGDQGGDLVELFSLKYGSKSAGIIEAKKFLGIRTEERKQARKVKKSWTKPVKNWKKINEGSNVYEYLTVKRKLDGNIVKKSVRADRNDTGYVFLLYTHDADPIVCGASTHMLKRVTNKKGKEKKVVYQQDNPLPVLYGHTSCEVDYDDRGRSYLIVTEGQIDCLSYRTQGFKNVVSIPQGNGDSQWIEHSVDFLEQFNFIFIHFDNDELSQKYAESCAKKIGFERCKKVSCPGQFNDANDYHCAGLSLKTLIDEAVDFSPSRLVTVSDIRKDTLASLKAGRREDVGIPFMGWEGEESVNLRIRPKEFTIWTGYPGHGKSNALYQMVANMVFKHDQKIFIASLEEDVPDILGLIAIHAIGRIYDANNPLYVKVYDAVLDYLDNKVFLFKQRGRASMDELIEHAEYTIRKFNVGQVVIDSVAKTDLNIEDNEQANMFVNKVSTSVDDTGCHYHLVAHSRKGNDESLDEIPGIQEIKGAAAFGIECFNCITVWKNKQKKGMLQTAERLGYDSEGRVNGSKLNVNKVRAYGDNRLYISKQKVGGATGMFELFYNEDNYRYRRTQGAEDLIYAESIVSQVARSMNIEMPDFL